GTLMVAPGALSASSVSIDSVHLSWTAAVGPVTGYQIIRQTSGTDEWTVVANVDANSTDYDDVNLQPGTQYVYEIALIAGVSTSTPSNQVTANTLPAAPTNLAVDSVSTNNVQLSWTPGP